MQIRSGGKKKTFYVCAVVRDVKLDLNIVCVLQLSPLSEVAGLHPTQSFSRWCLHVLPVNPKALVYLSAFPHGLDWDWSFKAPPIFYEHAWLQSELV